MQPPFISIRIPAYNHEQYIAACLDSILETKYPNLEIVVINDGSRDQTSTVIETWIKRHSPNVRIKYITRETNKGIAYTLNELNNLCEGEFVVGLASDDLLTKNSLDIRVSYLLQHPNRNAVIGDAIVVDDKQNIIHASNLVDRRKRSSESYQYDKGLRDEILFNWSIAGSVLMIRRSCLTQGYSYDDSLNIEDWDFYIRLVLQQDLGYIAEPVSFYRIHSENTSSLAEKRAEQIASLIKTAKKYKRRLTLTERVRMEYKILKLKLAYKYESLICKQY